MDLDRFSQGMNDAQEEKVVAYCEGCGGEIYPGEDVYVYDGAILHNNLDCLRDFLIIEIMTVEEALGVEK